MNDEEGASPFSIRILDCSERLLDELPARDFAGGEKTRKLSDRHCL
jgi:hypothetical protein